MSSNMYEIPLIIGDKVVKRSQDEKQIMPFDKSSVIASYTNATKDDINEAIDISLSVREKWAKKSLMERGEIFLRAADLCAGKYRMELVASTMLGQGKTIIQAEIDAACELIDFLRFNVHFALNIEKYKPISTKIHKNEMIYRPMEGFVASIAPFNFTAIGGNLATAPALAGNVVIFKPSDTAVLSNYIIMKALEEAGLPKGVISFLPSIGKTFGDTITNRKELSAINFTGSMETFISLWGQVGRQLVLRKYTTFPRLVGECGGKNFHFIHSSANIKSAVVATILSGFEYSGQKCSACSRVYVPSSLWKSFKEEFGKIHKQLKLGDVRDKDTFLSAVINNTSFKKITKYLDAAKNGDDGMEIIFGGNYNSTSGFFIEPTLVKVSKTESEIFKNELFGPVISVFVYDDDKVYDTLNTVKDCTPFGLTGSIFSEDKKFIEHASNVLRDAVGNLYINDKSTGSIVGQQPFGGARMSGTNDKAGGPYYYLKWTSPQTIKTTSTPLTTWKYPHMD
uniref:Multifunctional fusion protein n=1 Tax=Parastrongyloides trichosuri TaxID=131310 RepID=A0A0N4Z280_PARTI